SLQLPSARTKLGGGSCRPFDEIGQPRESVPPYSGNRVGLSTGAIAPLRAGPRARLSVQGLLCADRRLDGGVDLGLKFPGIAALAAGAVVSGEARAFEFAGDALLDRTPPFMHARQGGAVRAGNELLFLPLQALGILVAPTQEIIVEIAR